MISICVPSRKRQHKVRKLLQSIRDTVREQSQVETLFFLDNNDLHTNEKSILEDFRDLNIKFFRCQPTLISGERYNFLADQSIGDILMYSSDDVVFTQNWADEINEIFNSFVDKLALVFSPDIIHGENIPTHGFVSRRSVEILGYLFYPHFRTWYNDCWLSGLYKSIGRYFPYNLGIVHQHFSQGFGEKDETYMLQEIPDHEGITPIQRDHQTWHDHQQNLGFHVELLRSRLFG